MLDLGTIVRVKYSKHRSEYKRAAIMGVSPAGDGNLDYDLAELDANDEPTGNAAAWFAEDTLEVIDKRRRVRHRVFALCLKDMEEEEDDE